MATWDVPVSLKDIIAHFVQPKCVSLQWAKPRFSRPRFNVIRSSWMGHSVLCSKLNNISWNDSISSEKHRYRWLKEAKWSASTLLSKNRGWIGWAPLHMKTALCVSSEFCQTHIEFVSVRFLVWQRRGDETNSHCLFTSFAETCNLDGG